ncbi:hypothetical protein ACFPN1_10165 [Lysobacter yangpyeongensis]|uniref:Uncharacterized protein n=1 Tax=Lysobacter yangpyeongensis TaxID=346182 RepID=A0ABW0SMX5_9GAMM
MSNVVHFLETLGASPNTLSAANYAQAVEALGVDAVSREALLARDTNAINHALDGRAAMRCLVFVPD